MSALADLRVRRAGLELELSSIRETWRDVTGTPAVAGVVQAFEEKLAERARTSRLIAQAEKSVATVAEPVDAPDCDSGSCGFESRPSPLSPDGERGPC